MTPPVKFVRPCSDCPFRRKSLRGWTGSAPPEWFVDSALADYAEYGSSKLAPCHETVDYTDPNWLEKLNEAAACVGSLIFAKNNWKSPRDHERAAAVNKVERDTLNVFATREEFIEHHRGGEFKSWEAA
jgi:hypothetical protein